MAEISIIVPVYNAVNTLERCMTSIKNQSFHDFEVVVVDDGSRDGSSDLVKKLMKGDDRFRLFSRDNHGVSQTRQFGLEQVHSRYVTFVDSDDWVSNSWLNELYTEAEEKHCDIVSCDLTKVYIDHEERFCQEPTDNNTENLLGDLMCGKIWGSCCNKLVRMSCVEKYGASFHPDMNMWEDLHFFWHLMKHDLKCSYIPKSLYSYDCFSSGNSIVRYRKVNHIKSAKLFVDSVTEEDFLPYCKPGSAAYERIKRGIYQRKCMIKRWAFLLNDGQLSARSLFPEVNKQFISETSQEPLWSENRCIALALKGYGYAGRFIYKASEYLFRLKSRITGAGK